MHCTHLILINSLTSQNGINIQITLILTLIILLLPLQGSFLLITILLSILSLTITVGGTTLVTLVALNLTTFNLLFERSNFVTFLDLSFQQSFLEERFGLLSFADFAHGCRVEWVWEGRDEGEASEKWRAEEEGPSSN